MRKPTLTGILSLVFILVYMVTHWSQYSASPKSSTESARVQQATQSAIPSASPSGKLTLVTRVIDGDTIQIETGEKVRYIGVNTPESVDPRRPLQCYGHEASAKNKELVEGKAVMLEKDVSNKDKYGRLLRYVWVGDRMINEVLVREGYAQVDTYPPDVKYKDKFVTAQRQATAEKVGLWGSACNLNPK